MQRLSQVTAKKGLGLPQLSRATARTGFGLPQPPRILTSSLQQDIENDPNFQTVGLLLNMNGPEDSQTFVDSSPRTKTIVSTGTVRITNILGVGAAYFDGSGTYLNVSGTNSDLAPGTADFDIEFNVLCPKGSQGNFYDARPGGGNGAYITWGYATTGLQQLYANSGLVMVGTINLHDFIDGARVRLRRVSGVTAMYVNEVLDNYANDTTNYLNGVDRPVIGVDANNGGFSKLNAFVKSMRMTKSVARDLQPSGDKFPEF
jgi:hypothetical protein